MHRWRALAVGISTFADSLKRRKVRIWSDNKSAEAATRKGAAKQFDHASLIHGIWLRAAELGMEIRVDRVPTKQNIADLPSREEYNLLGMIGAEEVATLVLSRLTW